VRIGGALEVFDVGLCGGFVQIWIHAGLLGVVFCD
jgi:hypothetical protein